MTESLLRDTAAALDFLSPEEAAFEARQLVSKVLDCSAASLRSNSRILLSEEQAHLLQSMVERRLRREPLQYILGEWSFYGLPFLTDPEALIPRSDTEVLVDEALKLVKRGGIASCLDLCCGTGCIGISIAKYSGISADLADLSPSCCVLSARNAELNGARVGVFRGDLFDAVPAGRTYDLIVSNPPYLTAEDMQQLQPELNYEPSLALQGGEDGLLFYRRIAEAYERYLNPGGVLLMEIGEKQAADVTALFPNRPCSVITDLENRPRVIKVCEITQ